MTLFVAAATINANFINTSHNSSHYYHLTLHRDRGSDSGMRFVVNKLEVIQLIAKNILRAALDKQVGQLFWRPVQLLINNFFSNVIIVEMTVAKRMHEIADFQPTLLRNHMG